MLSDGSVLWFYIDLLFIICVVVFVIANSFSCYPMVLFCGFT